jgi:hypothetical protein
MLAAEYAAGVFLTCRQSWYMALLVIAVISLISLLIYSYCRKMLPGIFILKLAAELASLVHTYKYF